MTASYAAEEEPVLTCERCGEKRWVSAMATDDAGQVLEWCWLCWPVIVREKRNRRAYTSAIGPSLLAFVRHCPSSMRPSTSRR